MGVIQRKYATGADADIYIPIIQRALLDFADDGDWTPAAGDVKVSKDGGAQANIGTLPVYTNGAWKFVFSNAELTCRFLSVMVIDLTSPKVIEDQAILIETYGHASAQHAFDLDTAEQDVNVVNWLGETPFTLAGQYIQTYVGGIHNIIKNAIADRVLDRPISSVEPGAVFRTLYGAVASLVNRVKINTSGNLEVYKTNDSDVLETLAGTTSGSQDPYTELDPP